MVGKHRHFTFGFGKFVGRWGVLSRATGEFTGSDLTFAMVGGIPSAPGQIPYKDVKKVMDILHDAMYPKGA